MAKKKSTSKKSSVKKTKPVEKPVESFDPEAVEVDDVSDIVEANAPSAIEAAVEEKQLAPKQKNERKENSDLKRHPKFSKFN
jgi:hypothetical protein